MAMRRAVVSTTSGCAGLGMLHGHSVWVADTPEAFGAGIATLIGDPERREQIALAAAVARRAQLRLAGDRRAAAGDCCGRRRATFPSSLPGEVLRAGARVKADFGRFAQNRGLSLLFSIYFGRIAQNRPASVPKTCSRRPGTRNPGRFASRCPSAKGCGFESYPGEPDTRPSRKTVPRNRLVGHPSRAKVRAVSRTRPVSR